MKKLLKLQFGFLLVLLVPGLAVAEQGYLYKFGNGASVEIFPSGKLFYSRFGVASGQGAQTDLHGNISSFTASEITTSGFQPVQSANNFHYNANIKKGQGDSTTIIEADKPYLVTENGVVTPFPNSGSESKWHRDWQTAQLSAKSIFTSFGGNKQPSNVSSLELYHTGDGSYNGEKFKFVTVYHTGSDIADCFIAKEDGTVHYTGQHLIHDRTLGGLDLSEEGVITLNGDQSIADLKKVGFKASLIQTGITTSTGKTIKDEEGKARAPSEIVKEHFRDLSAEVAASDRVFDVHDPLKIDDIRRSLAKKEVGSSMITGESGSGKTELVRSFIKSVSEGKFPELAADTHFILVDSSMLEAGTKYTGMFAARVNALISYAKQPNVILVLDEAHNLRGAGTSEGKSTDFFQALKPYLADGSIRAIGMTTHDEYNAYFAGDPAIGRRMPEIKIKPIPKEKIPAGLQEWAKKVGHPPLPENVLNRIISLSSEYDAIGTDMTRAVRLAEDVYADSIIAGRSPQTIDLHDVELSASRLYQVDKSHFDPHFRLDKLDKLETFLNEKIVGHEELKTALVDGTTRALAGAHDRTKPQMRLLFSGPKGLAKTYVAEQYAKAMDLPFLRINMSEYVSGKSADDLLRQVGAAIRKNPFTVILFDEIEKAPLHLQNALLSIMDSDQLVMKEYLNGGSSGPSTYVRMKTSNTKMLFATNAGQDYILDNPTIDLAELKKHLKADGLSEFLSDRMVEIHAFHPPRTVDEFKAVIGLSLKGIAKTQTENQHEQGRFLHGEVKIEDQEALLDELTKIYYRPGLSFRTTISAMDSAIGLGVAREVLGHGGKTGDCVVQVVRHLRQTH